MKVCKNVGCMRLKPQAANFHIQRGCVMKDLHVATCRRVDVAVVNNQLDYSSAMCIFL